jgi:hypothetical protein
VAVKILTAAETAAIEAAVPLADAARSNADLAAVPAFALSPKAPVWCELVATHVYPLPESEVALRTWIGFERTVAERGAPLPVYAQLVERFRDRVDGARLAGDRRFLRRLADAAGPPAKRRPGKRPATRKPPALTIPAIAILVFPDVYAVLGRPPRPDELRAKVEAALGCTVSNETWSGVLKVLAPIFLKRP